MPPVRNPTPSASTLPHLIRRASSSLSQTTHTLLTLLSRQQNTAIIPANYNTDNSPPPGTVIGIVLGSVVGFLLILWLVYTLMGGNIGGASSEVGSVVIRERKRSSRRGSSRRTSSRRESVEVREVREVRRPPVVERERIVVEERRESRPVPVAVVESSIGSEDEVVVIEEHSPPRRASSKKVREVREVRESGYRPVDPLAYGGGDEPLRDMDRRGSRRSNR